MEFLVLCKTWIYWIGIFGAFNQECGWKISSEHGLIWAEMASNDKAYCRITQKPLDHLQLNQINHNWPVNRWYILRTTLLFICELATASTFNFARVLPTFNFARVLPLSALYARSLEHIKHAIFPCTFKILYPICSRPSYTTKIHAAECEHFSYLKLFGFSYETLLCNLVQPFGLFLLKTFKSVWPRSWERPNYLSSICYCWSRRKPNIF